MKLFILLLLFFTALVKAEDYELGHGLKINDALNLGGYFSVDYARGKTEDKARLDDVAFLAYGSLSPKFSYLVELEAAPFYVQDYENSYNELNMKFHIERGYLNYMYSDLYNVRLGKFITPIGYWNLIPINVLRDTSSNPLYSYKMFPKFVTGVDVNGYLNEDATVKYHVYFQGTDDIDEEYINIKNDLFIATSLDYEPTDELSFGSSLGYFQTKEGLLPQEAYKEVSLVQANAKYDSYPYTLQTEWAYTNINNKTYNTKDYQFGGYLQGMYNLSEKHAIVSRYEYFKDTQEYSKADNHIGVIGYSYRPMYSVSLKAEYQFNSDSDLSKSIVSFSVLF